MDFIAAPIVLGTPAAFKLYRVKASPQLWVIVFTLNHPPAWFWISKLYPCIRTLAAWIKAQPKKLQWFINHVQFLLSGLSRMNICNFTPQMAPCISKQHFTADCGKSWCLQPSEPINFYHYGVFFVLFFLHHEYIRSSCSGLHMLLVKVSLCSFGWN